MSDDKQPSGAFLLYTTEDGQTRVECHFEDETIWLSQALMAELFDRDVRTINEHLQNLFEEGELAPKATIRKFRIVRQEGKRQVARLELRAKQRQDLTLDYWRSNLDRMLEFNEQAVLEGTGNVSNHEMKRIANERYATFDSNCRADEAKLADIEDIKAIEDLEKRLKEGDKDD